MNKEKMDKIVGRLEALRAEITALSQKKVRLETELSMHRKALAEIESKAQKEFGCSMSELDSLAEKLEKEAAEKLAEAERILGNEP